MNKIKQIQLNGYAWQCDRCLKELKALSKEQVENWVIMHMTQKHNITTEEVIKGLEE